MSQASDYLLTLAHRLAAVYKANPKARAIMVTGSVAEGQSDFYSDLDFAVYYDELPPDEELHQARQALGGSFWTRLPGGILPSGVIKSWWKQPRISWVFWLGWRQHAWQPINHKTY